MDFQTDPVRILEKTKQIFFLKNNPDIIISQTIKVCAGLDRINFEDGF
jgi:hypothetical protein